jgi:23S rRNA pseudouridine2605 synthase
VRLHRYLAQCGVASRRKAEDLIREGRVAVDGQVVTEMGFQVNEEQLVTLDGEPVLRPEPAYFVLNKPKGYITTLSDERNRPTVVKFFPPSPPGLKTAGRLDKDTSGLLLVSNDGDFIARMSHPRFGVEKEYEVQVAGVPRERDLARLTKGLTIEGVRMKAEQAEILYAAESGDRSTLRLVLSEGRNRQVRRMTEAIGHPTVELTRVRIGHLRAKGMRPGELRRLSKVDVEKLWQATER